MGASVPLIVLLIFLILLVIATILYIVYPEIYGLNGSSKNTPDKQPDKIIDSATWSGSNIVTGATQFSSGSELSLGNSYNFGPAQLKLEISGDLVLLLNNVKIWSAGLTGLPSNKVKLRENNNLSVQDINGNELWSSKSQAGASPTTNNPSTLVYNIVLKQFGILDSQNKLLWNSTFDRNSVILFELGLSKTYPFKDNVAINFNSDGLVEFIKNGYTVWDTTVKGTRFVLKGDNNLVLLNGTTIVWESGTSGVGNLDLQTSVKYNETTGKIVLVDSSNNTLWTPDTSYFSIWSLDIGNTKDFGNGNVLKFKPDGSLELMKNNDTLWRLEQKTGIRLVLQNDNNMVLFDAKKAKVWETGTGGKGNQDLKTTIKFNLDSAFNTMEIVDSNNFVVWRTPVVSYKFKAGQTIRAGETIDFWWNAVLRLEPNGDLGFYKDGELKWRSGTNDRGIDRLEFVASQNHLALFSGTSAIWWTSNYQLGNIDGNTNLRYLDTWGNQRLQIIDSNGNVLWESTVNGK